MLEVSTEYLPKMNCCLMWYNSEESIIILLYGEIANVKVDVKVEVGDIVQDAEDVVITDV